MKEQIKNILFYTLITYSLFIVILTIINIFNINKFIELSDSDENITKINELKKEIETLPNNECKTLLNNMITAYEKTSFEDKVTNNQLYEIYYNGNSFLSFYEETINKCNITKEKMKELNMPFYFISSTSFIDNLVSKKIFDYELKIKDTWMREISEPDRLNLDYKLNKQNEIIIIENILNNIGGNTNE